MSTFKQLRGAAPAKFVNPERTADGQQRAYVDFRRFETLWFNTGSLCNVECTHCYIESSPTNDRLAFLTSDDIVPFLDEIDATAASGIEIGFTGGEPFLNPHMIAMAEEALWRGHRVLILTNAMRPMMRRSVQADLLLLKARYEARLTVRISIDHYTEKLHNEERGAGAFRTMLAGMRWLAQEGFSLAAAGRTRWGEMKRLCAPVLHGCSPGRILPSMRAIPSRSYCFPK